MIASGKALQEEGTACVDMHYYEKAWQIWAIASGLAWWELRVDRVRWER